MVYNMIMKQHVKWMLFSVLCLFLSLLPPGGLIPLAAQVSREAESGTVWIIPVKGDIEPSLSAFVRRETRNALDGGAKFIIFEIDTFGGRVDSALQITSTIMSIQNARTVAWVQNSGESMGVSWSAGALIALSCAEIYMANGTSMGAAAPVTVGADGSTEATGEKTVAAVRSQMAALAERNGHPVGIALAMADFDVELWEVLVDGKVQALTLNELERLEREETAPVQRVQVISAPGKLLSLTAGEAFRYGLTAGIADDRNSLLSFIGAGGEITESSPGVADTVISLLTSAPVQAILIILGLIMIFLEINTPGFGIPGTVAVICFLVVFGSGTLLGRVGSLELILFLAGIGLLAVEIFVLPGFGVMGISGIVLIGLSLVFSMQDFILPRFDWEWSLFGRNIVVVIIGIIVAITGIALIALMGPRIRLFDRLTLKTRITGTASGPLTAGGPLDVDDSFVVIGGPQSESGGREAGRAAAPAGGEGTAVPPELLPEDDEDYRKLLGKTGIAASTLRPSGKAEIEGRLYSVEGDGVFIESGKPVKVVRVRGNNIIVQPV
jgi:membrane-bound serine protease (ClpP class)